MNGKDFNLLDEPWILVMNATDDIEEVSLLDAFRRARTLKGLAGELPTYPDVAIANREGLSTGRERSKGGGTAICKQRT
jgi:hypothetical protein